MSENPGSRDAYGNSSDKSPTSLGDCHHADPVRNQRAVERAIEHMRAPAEAARKERGRYRVNE